MIKTMNIKINAHAINLLACALYNHWAQYYKRVVIQKKKYQCTDKLNDEKHFIPNFHTDYITNVFININSLNWIKRFFKYEKTF